MKRREFMAAAGLAATSAGCGSVVQSASEEAKQNRPPKPVSMYVGTQRSPTDSRMLQFIKRHGVDHICGYPPDPGERGYWKA